MQVSLALPPGVYRNGTDYQARGRWRDADLVRWCDGEMRPIGGWTPHSATNVPVAGTGRSFPGGAIRTVLPWRDNNNLAWAALGTASGLWVMSRSGAISDITPAGFVSGRPDALVGGGYGSGPYGGQGYGTVRTGVPVVNPATVWSLDNWGPYLVGVSPEDQRLVQWSLDPKVPAQPIADTSVSPQGLAPMARALVVTNEHFLFALAAGGDQRQIAWPDQSNNTLWSADATNSAGAYTLPTSGGIQCGKRLPQGTGIWTDSELWIAQYIGGTLLYGFSKADSGCGALSRNCVATAASQAFWMGQNGFFVYNGYVQPLPCEVQDHVYANLDRDQSSKVTAMRLSDFHEVWWFYPSRASAAGECDSYVAYNYSERTWTIGALPRSCGADREVFDFPIMCGTDGIVYDHENGLTYDRTAPYAESGPFELPGAMASGERLFMATQLVADEGTIGQTEATFYGALYPNTAETPAGPYALSGRPTDVRFSARQVRLRVSGVAAPGSTGGAFVGQDWRWGAPRLEVQPTGRR